jgi:hypothetical protein
MSETTNPNVLVETTWKVLGTTKSGTAFVAGVYTEKSRAVARVNAMREDPSVKTLTLRKLETRIVGEITWEINKSKAAKK